MLELEDLDRNLGVRLALLALARLLLATHFLEGLADVRVEARTVLEGGIEDVFHWIGSCAGWGPLFQPAAARDGSGFGLSGLSRAAATTHLPVELLRQASFATAAFAVCGSQRVARRASPARFPLRRFLACRLRCAALPRRASAPRWPSPRRDPCRGSQCQPAR